ncbi:MAG: hypothetical protein CMJ35_07100 [Phycisphaerae bacterium]|nr:hypothetical protein [Phycisphaerae bacterium]MBM91367.1 hypothetical protein [Phycisphaerae bacterium]
MMLAIRQWISRAIALGVIGPIAAELAGRVVAPDGSKQHTLLSGVSLGAGIIALLGVGLLVALMGFLGGMLGGRRESLLGMGFVLGWVAWTSGRLGRVYQLAPDSGTLVMLAVEALVLLLVVLVVGALLSRNDESDPISSFKPDRLRGWLQNKAMLGAMVGALVASGVVAWLFGRSDLPGQSIGVGFLAGIMAGVVGAMIAGSMSEEKGGHSGTPYAPVMLGVMLCGVIAPLVGIFMPGAGALEELVYKGGLPGYLIVSPSAWAGGALIGVPVGHSWIEHSHAHAASGAKTTS